MEIAKIKRKHRKLRQKIESRLSLFKQAGKKGPKALFEELCFCILTPQSKAFMCDLAIRQLKKKGLLFGGSKREIALLLSKKVRFHNNKAAYLVEAREKLEKSGFSLLEEITFGHDEKASRALLVKSFRGIGWKEASHYLRNVGRGETIAILDRHILKNLKKCKVIDALPKSLTGKKYLEIEEKMASFCKKAGIPLSHLDLIFWAEETGKIFK